MLRRPVAEQIGAQYYRTELNGNLPPEDDNTCAICLEPLFGRDNNTGKIIAFHDSDLTAITNGDAGVFICTRERMHKFHNGCIADWVRLNAYPTDGRPRRTAKCPLCKINLNITDADRTAGIPPNYLLGELISRRQRIVRARSAFAAGRDRAAGARASVESPRAARAARADLDAPAVPSFLTDWPSDSERASRRRRVARLRDRLWRGQEQTSQQAQLASRRQREAAAAAAASRNEQKEEGKQQEEKFEDWGSDTGFEDPSSIHNRIRGIAINDDDNVDMGDVGEEDDDTEEEDLYS